MTIRKAARSDLRAMAEVSAAAFKDEELFGELMNPHRNEYPEDFVLFFEKKFLSHWYDPNHHFLVGLDKASEKIVAVAEWDRQGASSVSSRNSLDLGKDDFYYDNVERSLGVSIWNLPQPVFIFRCLFSYS